MSDWKPPPFGTPVWLEIPAQDVERAYNFYKKVFNLYFREDQKQEDGGDGKYFDLTKNGLNISGGIHKAPDKTGTLSTGRGGPCIFWFVEDLEASSKLIEEAGGKVLTETIPQGDFGAYRYFEDTEGTLCGIHMTIKK